MQKFWSWLKPKLVWILGGAGIVLGGVITVVTLGRSRPKFGKPPERPELPDVPDVEIPDVNTDFKTDFKTDLNDTVADDYEETKAKPEDTSFEDAMRELNES